ncbi:LCP family protein [Actinomyces sp. MRS3W]|uniref:LCP family protein n=1 Tax=Actinomyces sp. MRS3W TaxID=2800796 RepID=UPI0028FD04E2|nr:LCP family protein [Actinomyces sp. MRS3W]MDU0348881.1 LCP family protein [Actinomyces sp. MRS3W]
MTRPPAPSAEQPGDAKELTAAASAPTADASNDLAGPSVTQDFLHGLGPVTGLFGDDDASAGEEQTHHHRRGGGRRRRHRHRSWFRRHKAATVLLAILLVAVLAVAGVALWLRAALGSLNSIADPFAGLPSRAPYASTTQAEDPVTFLVLGSDSRIDTDDPSQWEVGAQRTDTIMLVQVSGDRQNVNVMSIPRDSWVTIPANDVVDHDSSAKLNAAYSWGGPTLLIETIESSIGIHIDHFAVANFESFTALTDELGGVEITLTQPLDLTGAQAAASSQSVLEPGTHTLTGEQALIYARERYTLPNGDFDRIKRQQNWMRAILAKAISADTFTSPTKLSGLISTIQDAVATDEGFTTAEMTRLGLSLSAVRSGDVAFFQAPVTGTSTSEDGQSIVLLDVPALAEVTAAFQTDSLTDYVAEHEDSLNMLGTEVN